MQSSTKYHAPIIDEFDGLHHVNHIFSESISHWQPVPPCSDPVPPSTNQYRSILIQYHQVTTETNKGGTCDTYDVIYSWKRGDKRILICYTEYAEYATYAEFAEYAEFAKYAEYAECAQYAECA